MKSIKFFAVALLLSSALAQAACNLADCNAANRTACNSVEANCPVTRKCCNSCPKRGFAKIAVGCVVGAAREIVPAGIMRNFSDALAVTTFMDGATDLCCGDKAEAVVKTAKPTSSTDMILHQVKRACLLMTSCWAANQIKTNALPHVPAGLADVVTKTGVMGDMALTWATYGACNSALDAVMPADDAQLSN